MINKKYRSLSGIFLMLFEVKIFFFTKKSYHL